MKNLNGFQISGTETHNHLTQGVSTTPSCAFLREVAQPREADDEHRGFSTDESRQTAVFDAESDGRQS